MHPCANARGLLRRFTPRNDPTKKTGQLPRKSYRETAPHIIKEIKMLRRKPRGLQKRKTFKEVAEVLNNKGYATSSNKPFTAMNVHKIIKRQG